MTVLIVGTPRSGTNNAAQYYRSLGLKVTHEKLGQDYETIDVSVDYHQLNHLSRFPLAIYITREPVANVKSLGGLLRRKGQYRRTLGLFPELAAGDCTVSPLELACEYWLHTFRCCRHLPHLKAESLPIMDNRVVNSDHQEGAAGIPEELLTRLIQAGRELGYYSRGALDVS